MKNIITSVSPYLCEKIMSDDCKILVKKSTPKEVPFKAYIYCTKEKPCIQKIRFGDIAISHTQISKNLYNGKVIGEFICDRIDRIEKRGINNNFDYCYLSLNEWGNDDIEIEIKDIQKSCIPKSELNAYGENSSCLYGWHISDLKIYDKPKELSEFKTPPCEKSEKACGNCRWLVKINTPDVYECECYVEDGRPITRPPQSWQYVEKIETI